MSFSPTPPPRPSVPFHQHAGIEILDAPLGIGRTSIPDRGELTNHFGTVHAGMLFSVGEVAAGVGVNRLLTSDSPKLRIVTRRASIDYLKPARGAISGEGRAELTREEILAALELGPAVDVPVAVELRDSSGLQVAKLRVELYVSRPKT